MMHAKYRDEVEKSHSKDDSGKDEVTYSIYIRGIGEIIYIPEDRMISVYQLLKDLIEPEKKGDNNE